MYRERLEWAILHASVHLSAQQSRPNPPAYDWREEKLSSIIDNKAKSEKRKLATRRLTSVKMPQI